MSFYHLLAAFILAPLFCLSESLVITEPNLQNVLQVVKVSALLLYIYFALILGT